MEVKIHFHVLIDFSDNPSDGSAGAKMKTLELLELCLLARFGMCSRFGQYNFGFQTAIVQVSQV